MGCGYPRETVERVRKAEDDTMDGWIDE